MANAFNGNEAVQSGYYLNISRMVVEPVAQDGGRLPAGAGAWYRVPTLVAILATPIFGLAFLMFLPLIGFLLTAQAAVMKVTGRVSESATELAASVSPGLATGAAYLAGKEGEEKEGEGVTPEVEKLEQEIAEKRAK